MAADMFKNPRKKKGAKKLPKESPFPIPIESITHKEGCDSRWFYYTGNFRDNCVVVEDLGDLTFLYRMGFFGKGNMSRSKPEYEIISDISQKAFSNSEKLRRLPPKERQIRQSKFRKIRKERFRNHSKWQRLSNELSLSNTQESPVNEQSKQNKTSLEHQSECLNTEQDSSVEDSMCKKRKTDEQQYALNEDDSSDSDDSSNDITEVTKDDSDEDDITDKDITEVEGDVIRDTSELTENCLQTQSSLAQERKQKIKKKDPYKVYEHLQLNLEEAFFLSYGLGCLTVYDDNQKAMTLREMWTKFCQTKKNFIPCYTVYHYFRSKGWVPKCGIKYGTDFVVYKEGMPFYHSSYSVIVQTAYKDSLEPISTVIGQCKPTSTVIGQCRPISWASIGGLNRVSEHVAKEIMICYVIVPPDITERDLSLPNCVCRFEVQELVLRRWLPERSRETNQPKS